MKKDMQKYLEYLAQNRQRLNEKWGFDVPEYSGIESRLIAGLPKDTTASFRVLELCAGCGITLSRIRYTYPNAVVAGIEPEERIAVYGRWMSVLTPEDFFRKEHEAFDYILIGIAGQRTEAAKNLAERVKHLLKPDGKWILPVERKT